MRLATAPTATAANREYLPSLTLKPAKSIVASDGIGIPALSGTISRKIPGRPRSPTTLVAKSASRSVTDASTSAAARSTRGGWGGGGGAGRWRTGAGARRRGAPAGRLVPPPRRGRYATLGLKE